MCSFEHFCHIKANVDNFFKLSYIHIQNVLSQQFKVTPLGLWYWRQIQWFVPYLVNSWPYTSTTLKILEISNFYWSIKIALAWMTFAPAHMTFTWHFCWLAGKITQVLTPLLGPSPMFTSPVASSSAEDKLRVRESKVLCKLLQLSWTSKCRCIFGLSLFGIGTFTCGF